MLPGLVDAHTHLDKTFTRPRMGSAQPGLLGAIDAMAVDRRRWTEADVAHLRTHCDWWEPDTQPLAWSVLRELAQDWADRLRLERMSLDTVVATVVAKGFPVAGAAGNNGQNACNCSPARGSSALTVGATTSKDSQASHSNFGSCLDLFASGSSIKSAWYTSSTATVSGTSMASP